MRSRTRPAPSVLSPYQRPSGSCISVFTAPASCARLECSDASANASTLNGTVTLRPRPPLWRKASTVATNPSSGASRRSYDMSAPIECANAAWICGDLECATGLPMTA